MSANVELARRAIEAYNAEDVEAIVSLATEDCEFWTFIEGRAEAEPLRGHAGVRQWRRSGLDASSREGSAAAAGPAGSSSMRRWLRAYTTEAEALSSVGSSA